jgi:hypothetical protein
MICPLCGQRKARRACPALGHEICATCCGTKRLTQIRCPSDCVYLASAREHPPAVAVRQQQHDVALLIQVTRDFSQRQTQLFLLVGTVLNRYPAPDLQPLIDDDLAQAAAALAATYETASRGVIYEHRPASLPAERLLGALKPVLADAGQGGGTPFERDAATVLRRVGEAIAEIESAEPENRRAFLDLLGRVLRKDGPAQPPSAPESPGLIVP